MKILMIGPLPPPIDGCSNANKVLLKNLQLRNLPVEAINTNTAIITKDQGSKFSLKKATRFVKNYLQASKIFKADVVYFTPGQTFYGVAKYAPFILLCILTRKPYTIHVHGNFLGKQYTLLTGIKKKIFHFLLSKASAGIVLTKSLSKNFDGILSADRIHVVENFAEDDIYARPLVKSNDKLRILYLSNLMNEKGIIEVLDALITLKDKKIPYEAVIAGSMQTGIKDQVTSKFEQLNGNINYVGVVSGEPKIDRLMEANTFILPTYYTMEGLPISILEAMAAGNIIITTPHSGIPDVVKDGENGFLVQPKSATAISSALETISSDVSNMVNKYAAFNKAYANKNFTEVGYTDKIMAVLQSTAKG